MAREFGRYFLLQQHIVFTQKTQQSLLLRVVHQREATTIRQPGAHNDSEARPLLETPQLHPFLEAVSPVQNPIIYLYWVIITLLNRTYESYSVPEKESLIAKTT